ncbi:MAG: hypothetical protein IKH98_05250 [Candidatus Methanomethylophilaceae archaeon]|nr:hypothetical protein [Candidatus Methanomethylophilaceae archaeon]
MPGWSGIANALRGLFRSGGSTATWTKTWTANGVKNVQTVTTAAGSALSSAGSTVLTWGNAAKVAIVGAFSYLFLTGGASNVVSHALGISPEAAQILIIFGFVVIMILATRYVVNWMVARYGLDRENLDKPIIRRIGNVFWDEDSGRWVRRRSRCTGYLCWREY